MSRWLKRQLVACQEMQEESANLLFNVPVVLIPPSLIPSRLYFTTHPNWTFVGESHWGMLALEPAAVLECDCADQTGQDPGPQPHKLR